jgi:hypothetical protein
MTGDIGPQVNMKVSLSMLAMLLTAPLVGVEPGDRACILHGVTMEGIGKVDGKAADESTAACGVTCRILALPLNDPTDLVAWPVRAQLPEPFVRCRACWEATGKKRPRSALARPT